MHIVKLSKPLHGARWNLGPGEYLMHDISAFEVGMTADRGSVACDEFLYYKPLEISSTLLVSNAGFGDMLAWVPAIRKHRKLYPTHRLALSSRTKFHAVFSFLDFAPELLDYPVLADVAFSFSRVISNEGIQEDSDEGRTTPAIDICARVLGVGPLVDDERKTEYRVTQSENDWAISAYPRRAMKRIGIQLSASSPTRTYHPKLCGEVMRLLYEKGHELYLFGAPDSIPMSVIPENIRGRVKNLTADKLEFRQSAAVLQTCDCLFCPDSGLCHVAGATGVPTVAIFGSTSWKLRTAEYESVFAIQASEGCEFSPCHFHPIFNQLWPKGAPCEKAGHCTAINSIPPERIVAKIEQKLNP